MYKSLVLIVLMLCAFALGAELVIEENWSYTQGTAVTTDNSNYSINLPGGDILVVGGVGIQNANNSYNVYPCATRFNPNGSIEWQRNYTNISILENLDSEVVYAAIRSNGNIFLGVELISGGASFVTIDPSNGDVVSSVRLYTSLPAITLLEDDYVIIGRNFSVSKATFSKYTLSGSLINTVEYDVAGVNDIVNSLTAASDGGFWMAGKQGSKALVVKFDSVMAVEEEYAFQEDSGFGYEAQKVTQESGNLYIAGQKGNQGLVFKANAAGNVIWEQVSARTFFDVAVLDNGYVAAAGVYGDINNPRNYTLVLNQDGEYFWGDLPGYAQSFYGHFTHVAQTASNDFIVVGWRSTHTGTYGANWAVYHYHSWTDNAIVVTDIQPFEPNFETGNQIDVMEGSSIDFSITAYDPDGNPLQYNWFMEDETVSTTASYTFHAPIDQAGETYILFLNVTDQSRANLFYQWQINITEYVNPPYPPYSLSPYDQEVSIEIGKIPTLTWGYSSDMTHNQTHCEVYFGIDQSAITSMNPDYRVLGDGVTLYDSYQHPQNLLANQTYYWRVVVYNGQQRTIGDVWSFTTEQIVAEFPYTEGFDGQMVPSAGWKNAYSDDLSAPGQGMGGGWGMAFSQDDIHSGTSAAFVTPYQRPGYYWLLTPLFLLGDNAELSFWLNYTNTIENPTNLYVMVQTSQGWESLHSFNTPAQTNVYASPIELSLADYANQLVRVAFVYYANWEAVPVAIDEFSISAGSGLAAVQNLIIEQIDGNIRLSWDSVLGATSYKVLASETPEGEQSDLSESGNFSQNMNRIIWTIPASDQGFFRVKAFSND